ncbi:citrulline utilization hydrolase CtlX [Eisenibacter elegans]|jgi:hypothetical protein|uniref:citrulline utilization hydrolase CtlX n=1 Tax=Eisenibacter elegans TaxID=997 RepID=UPI00041E3688
MAQQTTNHILMIRPVRFAYNEQTAANNAFQDASQQHAADTQAKALQEFDAMVRTLGRKGVQLTVIEDTPEPHTPDSIFPNNWASYHEDGTVILYPMYAPNRRLERRMDIIERFKERYEVSRIIDMSHYETQGKFLESTGSVIFDRPNKLIYACYSPRTDRELLEELAQHLGYTAVGFEAQDRQGQEIYHTNVLMCLGTQIAVICMEAVTKAEEKAMLLAHFERTGKTVVDISWTQMEQFAGNMLEVQNEDDEALLVMSKTAYDALTDEQRETLAQAATLVPCAIPTIERNGGGSARCMMSEIFLPLQKKTMPSSEPTQHYDPTTHKAHSISAFMQTLIDFEAQITKREFQKIFGADAGLILWHKFTQNCGSNTTILYRILDEQEQEMFDAYIEKCIRFRKYE